MYFFTLHLPTLHNNAYNVQCFKLCIFLNSEIICRPYFTFLVSTGHSKRHKLKTVCYFKSKPFNLIKKIHIFVLKF